MKSQKIWGLLHHSTLHHKGKGQTLSLKRVQFSIRGAYSESRTPSPDLLSSSALESKKMQCTSGLTTWCTPLARAQLMARARALSSYHNGCGMTAQASSEEETEAGRSTRNGGTTTSSYC